MLLQIGNNVSNFLYDINGLPPSCDDPARNLVILVDGKLKFDNHNSFILKPHQRAALILNCFVSLISLRYFVFLMTVYVHYSSTRRAHATQYYVKKI